MANNQIKYQKVEKNNPVVWVCDWNGSSQGLGTIKNTSLSGAVIRQLGAGTFDLFKDDFVNYKAGVILCMNQGGMLNKFFTVASPSGVNLGAYRSISDSIVFKCVRMPGAFKDQKNILSSPYGYGEKLFLTVSIEDPDTLIGNLVAQVPKGAAVFNSGSSGTSGSSKKRMIVVYRDANIIGRCLKGSAASANSIGVWS